MSGIIHSCSHEYEIINEREGDIVCGDCGLVIDKYYIQNDKIEKTEHENFFEKNFVFEMLERLNVPKSFASYIFKNILNTKIKRKSETILSAIIYNTLIELKIPFTMKDISGVTGISTKEIFKEEKKKNKESKNVVIIDWSEILERACSKLNLKYKDYTLIKEDVIKKNSGFNPSTVISAHIYLYCKEKNIKISLKEISTVTGISCMSIKRYIKNVGSQRYENTIR